MVGTRLLGIQKKIGSNLLAISIGVVYLWFGSLKFFPQLSPAEGLAKNTIHELSFGLLSDTTSMVLLAILEVGIGILLLVGVWRKGVIGMALFHMALTFTPLILFPLESFQSPPWVPTLLGQYIGKNLIIVAALLSLWKQDNTGKKIKNKS